MLGAVFPETLTALATLSLARPERPLLQTYGYAASLCSRIPVDQDGAAIPWMPYCVVSILKERLTESMRVLEYGAGYSTLFFMQRVSSVASIEHDESWLRTLENRVSGNVSLSRRPDRPDEYAAAPQAADVGFDLIVLDGIHRLACMEQAVKLASDVGLIILDDSERAEYRKAFDLASSNGYRWLSLEGHKSGSAGLHTSTFFYRDGNCFAF